MMAAIAAAGRGAQVTLIEPNERLGKKLNITGKGRCNVTNNCTEEALLQNIPRNGKFLYSSFSAFNSQDAMAFFEELGVPLKTERGNRVFPQSDCSFDVSGALKHRLDRLKVHWSHDRAVSIETEEGAVTGVRGEKDTYPAEAVVLAPAASAIPPPDPLATATAWRRSWGMRSSRPTVHWFRWSVRTRPAGRCRGWL